MNDKKVWLIPCRAKNNSATNQIDTYNFTKEGLLNFACFLNAKIYKSNLQYCASYSMNKNCRQKKKKKCISYSEPHLHYYFNCEFLEVITVTNNTDDLFIDSKTWTFSYNGRHCFTVFVINLGKSFRYSDLFGILIDSSASYWSHTESLYR